ncbi:MAG: aldehyde dehydrogenase family protein [Persicimonas sp.]
MNYKGNYIAGRWQPVEGAAGEIVRENPCRTSETVFTAPWTAEAVDPAVAAAKKALPGWDRLGVEGRLEYLQRFKEALSAREDDLAHAIAREIGKPLWEAKTEARALCAKIDIMCGPGLELTAERHPEGLDNGRYRYRPLGVLGVLGPFNFPLHLPNGHIIPGLVNGNTVVVKPSELAGGCMQLYFECAQEAGFPDGVLNMVHGEGEVGAAVAGHRGVNGVLFTGSWETGLRIKRATQDHYWKLLALEMGGKNTSIVLEDAEMMQAVHEVALAAFLTAGQRCSATSRVVVRSEIADGFIDCLRDLATRVTVGDALDEQTFMGSLADGSGYEAFLRAQDDNERGNLTPLLEGGRTRPDLDGYYVKPSMWLANRLDATGSHQGRELFGPDIVVYVVDNDADAVRVANATEYGLSMSVFTEDEDRFEDLSYDLRAGVLNLNRSTCGASSRLPFGGIKKSGNHRPSALLAGQYCTYPQAQLREEAVWDPESLEKAPLSLLE